MKEIHSLVLRYGAALLLALSGGGFLAVNVFYAVFSWWTIWLSYLLVQLFHGHATLLGNFIFAGEKIIELIPACIASGAYALLALLILFTRGISLRKGAVMFFLGSLLILAANVIRIEILVALLLSDGVNYFERLHLFFWKALSSAYVAGVWIFLSWTFKTNEVPVLSDVGALMKKKKG